MMIVFITVLWDPRRYRTRLSRLIIDGDGRLSQEKGRCVRYRNYRRVTTGPWLVVVDKNMASAESKKDEATHVWCPDLAHSDWILVIFFFGEWHRIAAN